MSGQLDSNMPFAWHESTSLIRRTHENKQSCKHRPGTSYHL